MKKNNNILIILLISFLTLANCQSLKEGLSGTKKNNSDEFLIEKKNPLTKPPDYDLLPDPDNKLEQVENKNENFDLKKKLGQASENIENKSTTQIENNNLEKSILDKIKKN